MILELREPFWGRNNYLTCFGCCSILIIEYLRETEAKMIKNKIENFIEKVVGNYNYEEVKEIPQKELYIPLQHADGTDGMCQNSFRRQGGDG